MRSRDVLPRRAKPEGRPQTANALYAEYERHWRRVDDLIAPTTGGWQARSWGRRSGHFHAQLRPRAAASRVAAPRGKQRAQFRAEAGAVLAGSRDGIPSTLLFRTGGGTTVRGYDFEAWAWTRMASSCQVGTMR
jgi:translocation and assembly module TamA